MYSVIIMIIFGFFFELGRDLYKWMTNKTKKEHMENKHE